MAIQITDGFTQLGNRLHDIADVDTSTRLQWVQNISNYIYKEIAKTDPERFIQETTINVIAGTKSYALPANFWHVQVTGCGVYRDSTRKVLTSYGSNSDGYYIAGTSLYLTPEPTESYQLTLRYIAIPPQYATINDYLTLDKLTTGIEIIPEYAMQYLIDALVSQYMAWDEDVSGESYSDARVIRSLNNLLDGIRTTPGVYEITGSFNFF